MMFSINYSLISFTLKKQNNDCDYKLLDKILV